MLGLDSLRAMQLRNEIEERFGCEVPIEALLGDATIGSLRSHVRLKQNGDGRKRVLLSDGPIPLSESQRALYFLHEYDPTT